MRLPKMLSSGSSLSRNHRGSDGVLPLRTGESTPAGERPFAWMSTPRARVEEAREVTWRPPASGGVGVERGEAKPESSSSPLRRRRGGRPPTPSRPRRRRGLRAAAAPPG